jgi:ligand-binding sensor domain-containing protein
VFCRTRSNDVVVVTPDRELGPKIVVSAMPADCASGPALGLDAGGRLLVGTENGLCLVAEGETRALRGADGRPLLARWLHEGHAGDWWLLARDRPGVARLRGLDAPVVEVRWFGREDGLPDGMLWFGAEDREGDLWFAGTHGLTRFEVTSGRAIDLPWPTGLAVGVIQGICVAADARVYVSTGGGLVRFDPARLRPSAGPRTLIPCHCSGKFDDACHLIG